jgi:hypothetical protein
MTRTNFPGADHTPEKAATARSILPRYATSSRRQSSCWRQERVPTFLTGGCSPPLCTQREGGHVSVSPETLGLLLAHGAKPDFTPKHTSPALTHCAAAADVDKVELLLEARAPVAATDRDGRIAFDYANSNAACAIQLLHPLGALCKDSRQNNVLMRSITDEMPAEAIREAIAQTPSLDATNEAGETAMHLAAGDATSER